MRSRQRAFELIERDARLQRRRGVNQIGDRFRLDQIPLAVEKRAQRELAGLGQPRPGRDRARDNRLQHDRAAMRADFDDVLAGVGVRCGEVGRDDFVGLRVYPR